MSFFSEIAKAKASAYGNIPQMIPTGSGDSVQVTVDGEAKTLYIVTPDGISGGSGIGIPHNTRGYFSETPNASPENFFTPNLLGGSVEYDVDLSQMECGCIAAFYTVSMPGKDDSGNYWWSTDSWGYCDANQVAGNWCPEFDLMEADKWSWATTAHHCDAPSDKGHYYNCDRGGLGLNIVDQLSWDAYGPGDNYQINTYKEFHAKVEFNADSSGNFSSFSTTFSQEGRTQVMSADSSYYGMGSDIANGMGLVISNWGGDASWLWKDRCSGSCNWPELSIKNIKVTTGSVTPGPSPGPTPAPYDPSDYAFGDQCGDVSNCTDLCSCPSNDHCRWSWSWSDPGQWAGDTARCRCDIV